RDRHVPGRATPRRRCRELQRPIPRVPDSSRLPQLRGTRAQLLHPHLRGDRHARPRRLSLADRNRPGGSATGGPDNTGRPEPSGRPGRGRRDGGPDGAQCRGEPACLEPWHPARCNLGARGSRPLQSTVEGRHAGARGNEQRVRTSPRLDETHQEHAPAPITAADLNGATPGDGAPTNDNGWSDVSLLRRVLRPQTLVSFGLAAAIVAFMLTRFDLNLRAVLSEMRHANPIYLGLAFASYYGAFGFRAARWRSLL